MKQRISKPEGIILVSHGLLRFLGVIILIAAIPICFWAWSQYHQHAKLLLDDSHRSLGSLELETVNAVRIIIADTNSYSMVLRSQNCLYQANASSVKAGEILLQLVSLECDQETTQIHPDDALATITVDATILRSAIVADVRNEIEAGTIVNGSPWMHLEPNHSSSS
jgi:hypothetical protein